MARAVFVATIALSQVGVQAVGAFLVHEDEATKVFLQEILPRWRARGNGEISRLSPNQPSARTGRAAVRRDGHCDKIGPTRLPLPDALPELAPGALLEGWALACARSPAQLLLLIDGVAVGIDDAVPAARRRRRGDGHAGAVRLADQREPVGRRAGRARAAACCSRRTAQRFPHRARAARDRAAAVATANVEAPAAELETLRTRRRCCANIVPATAPGSPRIRRVCATSRRSRTQHVPDRDAGRPARSDRRPDLDTAIERARAHLGAQIEKQRTRALSRPGRRPDDRHASAARSRRTPTTRRCAAHRLPR